MQIIMLTFFNSGYLSVYQLNKIALKMHPVYPKQKLLLSVSN